MAPAFPRQSCNVFPCQPNGRKKPGADVTKSHVTVENGTLTVIAVPDRPVLSCPVTKISALSSMITKIAKAATFLTIDGEDWGIDFQLSATEEQPIMNDGLLTGGFVRTLKAANKRAKKTNRAFRAALESEGMRPGRTARQ